MAKPNPRTDIQHPRPRRGLERRAGDTEPRRGPPHQRGIAEGLGRCDQDQLLRVLGQVLQPPQKALLDPARQRQELGQPEPAGELRGRQASRKLEQRERVSAGLRDDPIPHARIERAGDHPRQQRTGILVGEPFETRLGETRERPVLGAVTHGEDERHGLGQQPSPHEPQDLCRGTVEPLRVIDEAQQRALRRHLRQQRERGQGDQEPVGRIAGRQAQRDAQS